MCCCILPYSHLAQPGVNWKSSIWFLCILQHGCLLCRQQSRDLHPHPGPQGSTLRGPGDVLIALRITLLSPAASALVPQVRQQPHYHHVAHTLSDLLRALAGKRLFPFIAILLWAHIAGQWKLTLWQHRQGQLYLLLLRGFASRHLAEMASFSNRVLIPAQHLCPPCVHLQMYTTLRDSLYFKSQFVSTLV